MISNMKKSVVVLAAAAMSLGAHAQNLESGVKMYNYHRWQSAQRILQPLAATDARANYYLGLNYIEQNDLTNATACFTKFPEDPANVSGTAMIAFVQKDTSKAMHILRDLAGKAKKKEYEQLRFAAEAIIRTQGGDYMQAIAWDSAAVKRGAKDAAIFIALGDAFRKITGGGGSAMDNYEHARDAESCNSLACSRIGDLWFDATNYKLALENYSKAKECDATNPLPYKALAEAFQRSGRYDKALENMQQYMKLSDNSFNDKKMNAEILYQSKNYCDAITQSRELMKMTPMPDSVKMELYGIIGFSQPFCNDSLGAVDNIRKYLSMQNPAKIRSAAYIDFGKLWLKLNDLDSAGYYYALGLKADTSADKTEMYRQLADAYKAKKNYCKSAEWYDNLVKASPETQPADYAWRSIMFYYCGDYANGLIRSQEFMKKYPDQPSAYLYAAKSAANIDSTDTSGLAVPFYDQWLEKVGPNYDKKNELKSAYGYELTYFFNKEDKDKLNIVKEKLRALDPADKYLKQIEDLEKEAAKAKNAHPAAKTPPKK
jgi:hypothetical protein